MLKIAQASYLDGYRIRLRFSDGMEGVFNATELFRQSGGLLAPLRYLPGPLTTPSFARQK